MTPARPPGEGRLLQSVYYAYVVGSAIARMMPERLAYAFAHVAGTLAARNSRKRGVVARNIARIVGEPPDSDTVDRLVTEAYRSYARYWLETFRLVRESKEFFLERFRAAGEEHIREAVAAGRGAVVAVGHLGNWDAAGAWVAASGYPCVTVAEVLRPRRMYDFFVAHRARLGITIHPAEKGVTATLIDAIASNRVVALLGDRDIRGTGIEVTFFGEPTTMPPGPASIALRTGAPLMVAGVYGVRRPDGRWGWEAEITPPLPVPEHGDGAVETLTQEVAASLERMVAKRPEEWHVFQPFWLGDRRPLHEVS